MPSRRLHFAACAMALFAGACQATPPVPAPDVPRPSVADDAASATAVAAGAAVGVAATAPAPPPDAAAADGGLAIATCEMLGQSGDLATTTGVYVGLVIPAVQGKPVGERTMNLDDAQRDRLRRALRGLKGDDGRFCGVVDDPGGWE